MKQPFSLDVSVLAATTMALIALAPSAQSSIITGVSIADYSSQLGELSFQGTFERSAVRVIDGSGFDESTGFHVNAPDSGGGLPAGSAGTMWLSNGVFATPNDTIPAHIIFDLGDNYNLDSINVWNYNETRLAALTGRGANSVDISIASTAGGAFTSLGNFTFDQATGSETTDFGQIIAVTANNVRQVRFDILSNHGGDNQFVGLSEVRFDGRAVPEPGSVGLLSLGLSAFGVRRRRAKK